MKKSLAKKVTLSILAGAMLMTSSVAWAGSAAGGTVVNGVEALAVGSAIAKADGSIAIGANSSTAAGGASTLAKDSIAIGRNANVGGLAQQTNDGLNGVAIGASAYVHGTNNVAIGYGSFAGTESNVVSVGSGGNLTGGDFPETRRIINVTAGVNPNDAVNVAQLESVSSSVDAVAQNLQNNYYDASTTVSFVNDTKEEIIDITGYSNYMFTKYVKNGDNLTSAVQKLDLQLQANEDAIANVYTKEQADNTFVKISTNANDTPTSGFNVLNTDNITKVSVTSVGTYNSVVISSEDGITVGENSAHMDATGFYAGRKDTSLGHTYDNVKAAMTEGGKIKGADGKFEVDESGNVTAEKVTAKEVTADNLYTKTEIDGMLGGSSNAIAGINQRLEKTNAKINKVGAGAAALAALHPLEYDPDDKLTFSAGMGNYAGENAAALGAFYRPNEKFMVSLGGTMGNGENMVNLGLSIGLDKPNGFAKMSKRELIQEVNAVKAENNMLVQKVDAVEAELAEMKALLQAIMAKR